MADNKAAGAPALDTNIESGGFDEKRAQQEAPPAAAPAKAAPVEEEEEDEDMDALIEDLESQDGHDVFDEEEETQLGGGRVVPEDMLQTDPRVGLTDAEVLNRRRKYGLNQMKEEKENLLLKFLGFFVGPIQFVMEVSLLYFCFQPFFHVARASIVVLAFGHFPYFFDFWGPGRADAARNSAGRSPCG
jgi:H+-transporting ATPase